MKSKKKNSGELDLYVEIWAERPHVSFITGKPLGAFNICFFAHVLPKGTYPELRLLKENIILLLFAEHSLLDQGTRAQREAYAQKNQPCDWSRIENLKDELRSNLH